MTRYRSLPRAVEVLAIILLSSLAHGVEPFAIPLADDTETRGDWLGVYGRHVYVLCGARRPASMKGGPGWPIEYNVTTPKEDDPARAWISRN